MVLGRVELEDEREIEAERDVHRFGPPPVAAFGQAAEADISPAVDDQRTGQLGDAVLGQRLDSFREKLGK